MLADKPKLVFTDIAGKVTLEARLHVPIENRNSSSWFREETQTPCQQIKAQYQPSQSEKFNNALLQCGEALL